MAKKSRKNKSSREHNVVHPSFEHQGHDWHPLDDEINGRRDQKYVKNIKPRSEGQAELMKSIDEYSLTMAIGPAGTGKTYIAISKAAEALERGEIERIILSRPAMEAGESLGYLPGDLQEKMAHIFARFMTLWVTGWAVRKFANILKTVRLKLRRSALCAGVHSTIPLS